MRSSIIVSYDHSMPTGFATKWYTWMPSCNTHDFDASQISRISVPAGNGIDVINREVGPDNVRLLRIETFDFPDDVPSGKENEKPPRDSTLSLNSAAMVDLLGWQGPFKPNPTLVRRFFTI